MCAATSRNGFPCSATSSARWWSTASDSTATRPAPWKHRFGLNGYEACTLEEVGNKIGVTRERVRQIQIEALKKLREILESQGFSQDALFK